MRTWSPDGKQWRLPKLQALEQKLQRKNEVLSELLEEHTRLKKNLGRPDWPLGGTRHSRRDHGLYRTLVGTRTEKNYELHVKKFLSSLEGRRVVNDCCPFCLPQRSFINLRKPMWSIRQKL
jgi:hypothetical protein